MSAGSPSFLFINVARIGDTLLATPAMRAITSASPGFRIAALARLAVEAPAKASPLVGMNVATFPTKLFRRWPIEQFGDLSEGIAAEWPQAHILIFGGSEEREGARRLKERLGDRATLFAGR